MSSGEKDFSDPEMRRLSRRESDAQEGKEGGSEVRGARVVVAQARHGSTTDGRTVENGWNAGCSYCHDGQESINGVCL